MLLGELTDSCGPCVRQGWRSDKSIRSRARGDKSAMRPFAKLLCTLVISILHAVTGSGLSAAVKARTCVKRPTLCYVRYRLASTRRRGCQEQPAWRHRPCRMTSRARPSVTPAGAAAVRSWWDWATATKRPGRRCVMRRAAEDDDEPSDDCSANVPPPASSSPSTPDNRSSSNYVSRLFGV